MIADLAKNSASGLIFPKESTLEYGPPIDLNFPSGSLFNSESELLLCYDGQQNADCRIRYLDIIFDARGGGYDLRDLIYGIHRSFILPSFYKNN